MSAAGRSGGRTWRRRLALGAVVVTAGLAGVAGCGDDEQAASEAELCANVTELRAAIGEVTSLDPGSTSRADLSAALSDVRSAWSGVSASLGEVSGVNKDEVLEAFDDVLTTISNSVTNGQPVEENVDAVKASLVALQDTLASVPPDCDTGTTTTTP